MARVDTLEHYLTDIANSIRAKTGESGTIDASNFDSQIGTIGSNPNLQDKSVTIQTNTTTNITCDSGYDGLGTVSVTTIVPSPGTPSKGVVFSDWNNNGYPTTAAIVGLTTVPFYYLSPNSSNIVSFLSTITVPEGVTKIDQYAFYGCGSLTTVNLPSTLTTINQNAFRNCNMLSMSSLPSSITTIQQFAFQGCTNITFTSLPSGVTDIGQYTFQNCSNLALTSLPSGLTGIGISAFQSCSKLAIETIPDGVTRLNVNCFSSCTSLKKISTNAQYVDGGNSSNGAFYSCTNLKQVWIGSNIASNGAIGRYPFYRCNKLEKIYINKPRATVEGYTNYQYAFMNDGSKTGIIVCNDDVGFIDKATFDAQVIS